MAPRDQLTTRDAAELLGFTVQHVRRLIREGRLRGERLSRDWLIERESLERYMASRDNLELPIGSPERFS